MAEILMVSHSGFSDTEANGITMKNLLAQWPPEEKAQFYCNVSAPDFTAAHLHFRVTDMQMLRAFLLKKSQHIFTYPSDAVAQGGKKAGAAKKIAPALKRRKYNFTIKWLRELLWQISPWGHAALRRWVAQTNPRVLVYMVGESLFMDRTVLRICKKHDLPLVLYNCEAYRIIDCAERRGIERAYYRKVQRQYKKLNDISSLVIYNSPMLRSGYEAKYEKKCEATVVYNTAQCTTSPYRPAKTITVSYFGNLGLGRAESLITAAECLRELGVRLDVYGAADAWTEEKLNACEGIRFHGFLGKEALQAVLERSDILLHTESFEAQTAKKLRYAFSTKIAQYLCAGRCIVSFAPEQIASTQYLKSVGLPTASDVQSLNELLQELVLNEEKRILCACRALAIGQEHHTAQRVREQIGAILNEA